MADIEARGRRLFDPLKRPESPALVIELAMSTGGTATGKTRRKRKAGDVPTTKASRAQKRRTDNPLPPYARNPRRTPTVADIEARSRRLFEPLKRRDTDKLVIKQLLLKPLAMNRQASTVAAYFTRQIEQNQLAPPQRHAMRRTNKQYFDLRRQIFTDQRLTRQDKAQLVSVLTFERLKATEHIKNPSPTNEVSFMGSAHIRDMLNEETENPGYSISGAGIPSPEGARARAKAIFDRMHKKMEPEASSDRVRELAAKDLYTRKARFSQNVHYLDKRTDKTLFVDTGKAIAMRRTGITEAGVAVALQLAKERFGSTLTINGNAEFKRLVIEAVAKNGLDVHFTDREMNVSLAARKAELEIERDGQDISGAAPHTTEAGSETSPSELVRREAQWRKEVSLSEADVRGSEVVMGLRGDTHAAWLVGFGDTTPEAMAMIRDYMQNDAYRESFKAGIESLYSLAQGKPAELDMLDTLTAEVEAIVNDIEGRTVADSVGDPAADADRSASSTTVDGLLIAHGLAPYQHKEGQKDSYFVTLLTAAGERTIWSVTLADAMKDQAFAPGERVRLTDHGTSPVTILEPQEDGTTTSKVVNRREWSAESLEPERDRANSGEAGPSSSAATGPGAQASNAEADQDQSMNTD